jgi:hypothetical protein
MTVKILGMDMWTRISLVSHLISLIFPLTTRLRANDPDQPIYICDQFWGFNDEGTILSKVKSPSILVARRK